MVVNINHRHTNGLIGLSPYQVRIHFDRAMAMIGRCDHRYYAQAVSQTCGSNFTENLYRSVTNHVVCPNTETSSDSAKIDSTSKISEIVTSPVSLTHDNMKVMAVKSDTLSNDTIVGRKPDTLPTGKAAGCGFNAITSTDLYTVPISNRFSLLSQSERCPVMDDRRAVTTLDQVCPGNVQTYNPSQNGMDKKSNTANAQVGLKLSEDVGGFGQALQTAGVEFNSTQNSSHDIICSNQTHSMTDKCLQQLGNDFGCITLSDFHLYTGSPVI